MTITADWGEPVVTRAPRDDPFADDPSKGRRIDLTEPQTLMNALLAEENQLAHCGTECALKWQGQKCSTCPFRETGDSPDAKLCEIGLRQESLLDGFSKTPGSGI